MLKIGDIVGTEAQGGGLISRLIKFGNQEPGEGLTRVSHDAMVYAIATYEESGDKQYWLKYHSPDKSKEPSIVGAQPLSLGLKSGKIYGALHPMYYSDEIKTSIIPQEQIHEQAIRLTPENAWIASKLVESTSPKVINTRTVGYYLAKGKCYIYRIKGLDENALERIVSFALDRVGQRYGFRHIGLYAVSAALGRLFSYPVYWIARLLHAKVNFRSPRIYRNDPKAPMVCSQLVAAAYASLPSRICYPVLDEGRVWENPYFPGITRPYFKREYADYPKIEFGGPWGCIAPDDIDDWCLAESQLLDGRAEEIFAGGLKDV